MSKPNREPDDIPFYDLTDPDCALADWSDVDILTDEEKTLPLFRAGHRDDGPEPPPAS